MSELDRCIRDVNRLREELAAATKRDEKLAALDAELQLAQAELDTLREEKRRLTAAGSVLLDKDTAGAVLDRVEAEIGADAYLDYGPVFMVIDGSRETLARCRAALDAVPVEELAKLADNVPGCTNCDGVEVTYDEDDPQEKNPLCPKCDKYMVPEGWMPLSRKRAEAIRARLLAALETS